ncbi:hypothetical protein R1sor_025014 [Riccia sorocarpa]|uniref:Uncharacterized protein n=1 Tax=Riccia sorocarpa TaxID=122646 RepID=A0ABD3G8Q3_9MARC
MTQLLRPKNPSDCKNYHELRKPGLAHTIRLPEELLTTYNDLKRSIRAKTTHTDEDVVLHDGEETDPDIDLGDVAEDSEDSDEETVAEAGSIVEDGSLRPWTCGRSTRVTSKKTCCEKECRSWYTWIVVSIVPVQDITEPSRL